MLKFILKILIFSILIAVVDVLFDFGYNHLRSKATSGQTYKYEYIANVCNDDIIILGSSKADHHFVPSVFVDSLGSSCYNAGEMGCGTIPAYVRYKMISQRKLPKLIIYELTPGFDYLQGNSYSQYLGSLRQYTTKDDVQKIYLDFCDRLESLRILSSMYRNNSTLVTTFKDILRPQNDFNGYEPLFGQIEQCKVEEKNEVITMESIIDTLLLSYLERLIVETKKDEVPMVFTISPTYSGKISRDYRLAFQLAAKYEVPVFNCIDNQTFVNNPDLFQDELHLNHTGAIAFSNYIVSKVRPFFTH